MNQTQATRSTVERRFQLSPERARWLSSVARTRGVGESQIVEKALDILSSLTDLFEEGAERQGWSLLSEASVQRYGTMRPTPHTTIGGGSMEFRRGDGLLVPFPFSDLNATKLRPAKRLMHIDIASGRHLTVGGRFQ